MFVAMEDVNGVTGHRDLAEGTPAGTLRVTAPDAPRDGTPRRDPSDTRHMRTYSQIHYSQKYLVSLIGKVIQHMLV